MRGRPPEYLTFARLMLDSVMREVARNDSDPLVLENARDKDICECAGDRCFRDGVVGYIETPAVRERLCSEVRQLERARLVRVETFLEAADACATELAGVKGQRGLVPGDVQGWVACVVEELSKQGPYFD